MYIKFISTKLGYSKNTGDLMVEEVGVHKCFVIINRKRTSFFRKKEQVYVPDGHEPTPLGVSSIRLGSLHVRVDRRCY